MKLEDLLSGERISETLLQKRTKRNKKQLECLLYKYNPETHIEDYPEKIKVPKDNGKHRDIFIYSPIDTARQKSVYNYLYSKYSNQVSNRVFSYKRNVSTQRTVRQLCKEVYEHEKRYYNYFDRANDNFNIFVADISNYFQSLEYKYIKEYIDIYMSDLDSSIKEYLYDVFSKDKCYFKNELISMNPSLQPGSPLSTLFANLVLYKLDDLMENTVSVYARYADDIFIYDSNNNRYNNAIELLYSTLKSMSLSIKEEKVKSYATWDFEYIGIRVSELKDFDLCPIHWTRRKTKIKQIRNQSDSISDFYKRVRSWLFREMKTATGKVVSEADYIFNTCSSEKSIKWFASYIDDTARRVGTGKHNSINYKLYPKDVLNRLGRIDIYNMWWLYNNHKDEYQLLVNNL